VAWATVDFTAGTIHPDPGVRLPVAWQAYLAAAADTLRRAVKRPAAGGRLTFRSLLRHRELLTMRYHSHRAHDPSRAANASFHRYDAQCSRLAYLMFFVPRHARAVCQALSLSDTVATAVADASAASRPYVVAAVGGGPGADALGLLLYLSEHPALKTQPNRPIHLVVLDLPEWRPLWRRLYKALRRLFLQLKAEFRPADCTKKASAALVPEGTDLLLMANVLVEMQVTHEPFTVFFTAALRRMAPGGLVVSLEPRQQAAATLKQRLLHVCRASLRSELSVELEAGDGRPTATFREAGPALLRALHTVRSPRTASKGKRAPQILVVGEPSSQQPCEVQVWQKVAQSPPVAQVSSQPNAPEGTSALRISTRKRKRLADPSATDDA